MIVATAFPAYTDEPLTVQRVLDRRVTVSYPHLHAHFDPDQARALAAALMAAADRADDLRPLRRPAGVDDELRERDG